MFPYISSKKNLIQIKPIASYFLYVIDLKKYIKIIKYSVLKLHKYLFNRFLTF